MAQILETVNKERFNLNGNCDIICDFNQFVIDVFGFWELDQKTWFRTFY